MAKRRSPQSGSKESGQLEIYRAKRDFEVTAEPDGGKPESVQPVSDLPFVIQKHAATRLHYDFRLGWNGVLKSWAVTKGPSYNPRDKRLAVQVEDHPMDYKDFEGTIPKGQYGGGTVMVWDEGRWQPHVDVDQGLKEGSLKFELFGSKMKGNWALVRMNGRAASEGKSNWLLIKEHDRFEQSEDKPAIIDQKPLSVKTRRSLDQIAGAAPAGKNSEGPSDAAPSASKSPKRKRPVKESSAHKPAIAELLEKAPREKFPGFIAPQLAQPAKEPPQGADWVHELKLDGYRVQIHRQKPASRRSEAHNVQLLTRKGLDWTHRMAEIAAAAQKLPVEEAILDGEVVAFDAKGIASFADLQAAFQEGKQTQLTFMAFDLLHYNGHNLRGLPFLERKRILAAILQSQDENSIIRFSEHLEAPGKRVFEEACRLGAEGIISKLASAKYTSGRGSTWLKIKCTQQQELVIGGFTLPANSQQGIGALLLGYYQAGKLHYAGRAGTGFSQSTQRMLRERLDPLVRKKSAFADPIPGASTGVQWVNPELVAEIAFATWTRDNLVRQAAFKGLREDKPATEVVREQAVAPEPEAPQATRAAKPKSANASSKAAVMTEFALTHPEKVLDPSSGMTKHDLAAYYAAVAEKMLAYIADRPLSIVRCPEGSAKTCFFQKHVGAGIPNGVHVIPIPHKKTGVKEDYLFVDSAEGLVGLAQMGVLEIHTWGSHNSTLERPDWIVIDLDPDAAVTWQTLAASAKDLRKLLLSLGLQSFLKCTGGKGLHVVVPIRPEHEWPVIKEFTHALVQQIEHANPELYVTKMAKAARTNRIFLDYLRNDHEATAIAPFSPRARSGAPVALPLEWKELEAPAIPVFRVVDFTQWKKRLARDPWAGTRNLDQSLTADTLRSFAIQKTRS